jgi:hypothetical protein
MARTAPNLPAETDLLCEMCGYTLNGLPTDGNCPECGNPVERSLGPSVRQPSAWERDRRFFATTAEVIFRPTRFFRQTTTRGDSKAANSFGRIHTAIAAALFAGAGILHYWGFLELDSSSGQGRVVSFFIYVALFTCTYVAMIWTMRIAARLTTWEATYRGFRLPIPVVQRGLAFHAAHYLPIAIIALATTGAYQIALKRDWLYWTIHADWYLYVLSGEVVVGAMYLFTTYWIAMRRMMYANR